MPLNMKNGKIRIIQLCHNVPHQALSLLPIPLTLVGNIHCQYMHIHYYTGWPKK